MFILCFFAFNYTFAAKTFFEVDKTNHRIGDSFETGFILDTEGKDINAIEGKIIFSENLQLKEIRDGNSIINFWIERPKINNNEISFSGIVPGGYLSSKGLIFSLVFQALGEGTSTVEVKNISLLANDGSGTKVETIVNNSQYYIFKVTEKPTAIDLVSAPNKVAKIVDQISPEIFEPKVVSDSNMFAGNYFLVFATQDKGVGVDYYEVREEKVLSFFNFKFIIWESPWVKTESTYVLNDQSLHSNIYVKAVDKNANERVALLSPRNPVKWFEVWWIWGIIGLVLLVLVLVIYYLKKIICKTKIPK